MKFLLERELYLHADEELLVPKDELQDVDQPQDEVHGVEETTHATPTIRGRKRLTEAEQLAQDVEKVVGPPTAQRRQRQSPDRYTQTSSDSNKSQVQICSTALPASIA